MVFLYFKKLDITFLSYFKNAYIILDYPPTTTHEILHQDNNKVNKWICMQMKLVRNNSNN